MLTQIMIIKALLQLFPASVAGLGNWACVTDFPGATHFFAYLLYAFVTTVVHVFLLSKLIAN